MCAENKGGQKVGQISLRIRYVNMSSIFPRLGLFRSYFTWSQLPSSLQPYIAGVGPVCQRQYTLKKFYLASQITPRNDFLLRKYFGGRCGQGCIISYSLSVSFGRCLARRNVWLLSFLLPHVQQMKVEDFNNSWCT